MKNKLSKKQIQDELVSALRFKILQTIKLIEENDSIGVDTIELEKDLKLTREVLNSVNKAV